jgi:KamA family protein
VTGALVEAVCRDRLQTVVVIHSNHANEIDQQVASALALLARRDITLLNQTVLLAGVNDCAGTLAALSERLFETGVLPYYLHLLDRVHGAAHFEVSEQRAAELMGQMTARLPGYLVPRLVREVAGAAAKRILAPVYPD